MIDLFIAFIVGLVFASSLVDSFRTGTANLFKKRWARDEAPGAFWAIVAIEVAVLLALVFVTIRDLRI